MSEPPRRVPPAWAHYADLPPRARTLIQSIVVHRIEVSQEDPRFADTPAEVARFFAEHPVGQRATSGAMPYPLLIAADGTPCQCVPLLRVTPHAVSYNPMSIGVGCLGDFRHQAIPAPQWAGLVEVTASLVAQLGLESEAVQGHDELAGGSRDPEKICPGRGLPMDRLRAAVAARLSAGTSALAFIWEDP